MPLDNLAEKFKAFNWNCIEIRDGHSFDSIITSLKKEINNKKPTAFILHTIKARGIDQFENDPVWHAKKVKGKEIEIGKKELDIL